MILALALAFLLHTWLFYQRCISFYAQPTGVMPLNDNEIVSPVEGHLMYRRDCFDDAWITKEGRQIRAPKLSMKAYHQVGVYMSPMCNHHVFAPTNSEVERVYYEGDKLLPMLDASDMLWPLAWGRDWLTRKGGLAEGFIFQNKRVIYEFKNGIVMAVIFDKHVAKYKVINQPMNGRRLLGFIGRGSQVDLFIPADIVKWLAVQVTNPVGEKITYNTLISRCKNEIASSERGRIRN